MADHFIDLTAHDVRAIIREVKEPGEGKTQHRIYLTAECCEPPAFVGRRSIIAYDENETPYVWPNTFALNDRLWVQEEFIMYPHAGNDGAAGEIFRATQPDTNVEPFGGWCSAVQLPRSLSRLTLVISEVRVQRLQDISAYDAAQNGAFLPQHITGVYPTFDMGVEYDNDWLIRIFKDQWDRQHGKKSGYSWEDNPWVVAYTFTPHLRNIDLMGGEHG